MGHIEETLSDAGQSADWTDDEGLQETDFFHPKSKTTQKSKTQNPLAGILLPPFLLLLSS